MKITESSLKAIIKECLKEVLSEMVLQEHQTTTTQRTQQTNPLIGLIAASAAKGNPEQKKLYEGILTDAVLNSRDSEVIPADALNQFKQQQSQQQPSGPQANNTSKYPNRWAELAFNNNSSELTGLLASKMSD